ncbi:hypothetical protein LJC18_00850 [Lachnospiraceae bacterium OttesenSCG-928-E19]|nr:hypothetical protein [Lachnospiraceae bacterium OttesenSCG-928-E19]
MINKIPNPLIELKDKCKKDKYWIDVNNPDVRAMHASGDSERLGKLLIDKVEFIGGLWRVQNEYDFSNVVSIHDSKKKTDRHFKLLKELDIREHNNFTYYDARELVCNCYGWREGPVPYFVTNYEIFGQNHWAFNTQQEGSRAFLSARKSDVFQEVNELMANSYGDPEKMKIINDMCKKLGATPGIFERMVKKSQELSK